MDEITAKAFTESLLSTQHYTKNSFTPLSYEAFTIIPFYESGSRFKWVNDIPDTTELDEWWMVVGYSWYDGRLDVRMFDSLLDVI